LVKFGNPFLYFSSIKNLNGKTNDDAITTSANDKVSLTKYDFPFNAFSNTLTV
jgi:hypothetical protein